VRFVEVTTLSHNWGEARGWGDIDLCFVPFTQLGGGQRGVLL